MTVATLLQSYATLLADIPIPADRVIGIGYGWYPNKTLVLNIGTDDGEIAKNVCDDDWRVSTSITNNVVTSESTRATIKGTDGRVALVWFSKIAL